VIDPAKLPARALVDTCVLIRALQQKEDAKTALCQDFWREMIKKGNQILIAAPTVTEVTRSSKHPPLVIPHVKCVQIVPFDVEAARTLAERFPDRVLELHVNGRSMAYMRYDALILACACRWNAVLVTTDEPLRSHAQAGGASCSLVCDFKTAQAAFEFPAQSPALF
jgi:predicted nucleic acid-binding protein